MLPKTFYLWNDSNSIFLQMEALFVSAGLSEEKAKQTLKNSDLSSFLADSLKKIEAIAPITRDNGLNVYKFCTL